MRVNLQPAYILHSRPYRNTSKLLEIFSREQGRCTLVARGARNTQSRSHAALMPFTPLLLSWQGNGEVQTLISAEVQKNTQTITGRRLLNGFYLNELLLRLLPKADAHPELYDAYQQALTEMAVTNQEEGVLRNFEMFVLSELGYGLSLNCEAETGAVIEAEKIYYYDFEKGPLQADTAYYNGVKIRGRTLLALQRGELNDPEVLKEAKLFMRHALAPYLGNRPLKSRELYMQQKSLLKPKAISES